MTTQHDVQRVANRIARQCGYGRADEIILGDADRVVRHIRYGYRKYTTGEYVAKAYLAKFGWKNTYYQHAHTVVMLAI